MLLLFRDRLREERARGWAAVAGFWLSSLRDATVNGLLERWAALRPVGSGPGAPRLPFLDNLRDLGKEVSFSARAALKSPGHSAVTLTTLALGIGANTALFSVVEGVLLRPLPYPEPGRLVRVWDRAPGGSGDFVAVTTFNFFEWQRQERLFEALGAYRETGVNLMVDGEPERVEVLRVTASLFDVLRVEPGLGRRFLPEEDRPGGAKVVVLSHGLWQRRFGADPDVLRRSLPMDGESFTIVGVMPPGFAVPQQPQAELMMPFALTDDPRGRGSHFLRVLARLGPGVSAAEARALLERAAARLAEASLDTNKGWSITLIPLQEAVVSRVETLLLILSAGVGALLLLACVNVAHLSLARGSLRQQEIAVRAALGAGRLRLVRQLLVESAVFSLAGGLLALAVGWATLQALLPLSRSFLPRFGEVRLDGTVLLFTLALSAITGILFGLLSALRLSRATTTTILQHGARSTEGPRRQRLQRLLTAAEVAMAFMLLVAAGLLARSFVALSSVDPGLRTERLVSSRSPRFSFGTRRPRRGRGSSARFSAASPRCLESNPWAAPIGRRLAAGLPSTRTGSRGDPTLRPARLPTVSYKAVSPRYFETLGAPLVRGRDFTEQEAWETGRVAIVNQTMAAHLWPGESPLGKRIRVRPSGPWLEVVGVARDTREWGLDAEPKDALYLPYVEAPISFMVLLVRSSYQASALRAELAQAVRQVDPAQPLSRVTTLRDHLGQQVAGPRLAAWLMGIFAVLALAPAAIGIQGVVACSVAGRTREIGLRMAVGARVSDVVRMIVGEALATVAVGAVAGLAGALGMAPLLGSQIFAVAPTDPLTFLAVPVILALVALGASFVPALRAARVDPATALRCQ
jgi:putative ABC transport system permease protein